MRESLLDKLQVEYGKKFAPNGWATAIDGKVYSSGKDGGIRVYGANKMVMCDRCRGKRVKSEEPCINACQDGKIDEGRQYLIHSVYTDGARDDARKRIYESKTSLIVKATSIRTFYKDPTPNWKCYNGCPQIGDMLKTHVKDDGEVVHKIKTNEAKFNDDAKIKMGSSNIVDIHDPQTFKIFEKHIRVRFGRQYKTLRVVAIKKSDKGVYFIYVAGEGQHWCLNLKPPRDHERNTIFFQCTKDGICQRCRCGDLVTDGRQKGLCKSFCSTLKELDGSEKAYLFPEAKLNVSAKTFTSLPTQTATQLTQTQMQPMNAKRARLDGPVSHQT